MFNLIVNRWRYRRIANYVDGVKLNKWLSLELAQTTGANARFGLVTIWRLPIVLTTIQCQYFAEIKPGTIWLHKIDFIQLSFVVQTLSHIIKSYKHNLIDLAACKFACKIL